MPVNTDTKEIALGTCVIMETGHTTGAAAAAASSVSSSIAADVLPLLSDFDRILGIGTVKTRQLA